LRTRWKKLTWNALILMIKLSLRWFKRRSKNTNKSNQALSAEILNSSIWAPFLDTSSKKPDHLRKEADSVWKSITKITTWSSNLRTVTKLSMINLITSELSQDLIRTRFSQTKMTWTQMITHNQQPTQITWCHLNKTNKHPSLITSNKINKSNLLMKK
jgi:hypothetical protein